MRQRRWQRLSAASEGGGEQEKTMPKGGGASQEPSGLLRSVSREGLHHSSEGGRTSEPSEKARLLPLHPQAGRKAVPLGRVPRQPPLGHAPTAVWALRAASPRSGSR
ncbi:unnamed protein product [Prorocentrum cordatum]|uniref:Uncharacterized protein n=1 Tax=Prorocentrum cordatum TaxID=2364126 RepID=A0ABN9QFR6_9DINO|nr:unnamed protein product [Polarella glacialis]